jgi:RNA 3'-terminal phosphate cyclase
MSQPGVALEDVALQAARSLLTEIERGGCVDQKHQTLVLLKMVPGSEDVGAAEWRDPQNERKSKFVFANRSLRRTLQRTISKRCQRRTGHIVQDRSR